MKIDLSKEEIEYILSFLEDSTGYCETPEDFTFDEELKIKLTDAMGEL